MDDNLLDLRAEVFEQYGYNKPNAKKTFRPRRLTTYLVKYSYESVGEKY